MPATRHRLLVSAGLLAIALAVPAAGQEGSVIAPRRSVGRVSGRVTERGVTPVASATVRVVGTPLHDATDTDGRYSLGDVPAGFRQIRVDAIGYGQQIKTVEVRRGDALTLDFDFGEPQVVQEVEPVEVGAERAIDLGSSTTRHLILREEFERLPVDDVRQGVALKAGVVAQEGALHVRGGRAEEVKYRFDGVEVSDPLFGGSAEIANPAVRDVEILTGGFDAEYGDALSGFVNVGTNEGSEVFAGSLRWDTDRYGDPTKTFDDYDRLAGRVSGPTPIGNLTYFAAYEGTWSDTYLRSGLTHRGHTLWDFIELGNRQFNRIDTDVKLAYRIGPAHKVTLESIDNRTLQTPYNHMWSRRGFVQVDTIRTPGQPDAYRFGAWSSARPDGRSLEVNLPDHVPSTDDRFDQVKLAWTTQLRGDSEWSARLWLERFETLQTVSHQDPSGYWIESPQYWDGNLGPGTEGELFFATHGDFPVYSLNRSRVGGLKSDFSTQRWKRHTFQTGIEARQVRVASLALLTPSNPSDAPRSDFENHHPEAAAYVQDRWEFEGLVLNAGLRYDLFTPGRAILAAELPSGRRYKQQVSPRIGIAHPISTRDVLSFHYGRNFQIPARFYVYENRTFVAPGVERTGDPGRARGNPDLDPETNVAYQVAVQHLFAPELWGQFAVFFKDIYGLVTTRGAHDPLGNQIFVYANGDYASARGFEASVVKGFSHWFSAELNYTYQIATGVASDPRQAQQFSNGGRLYLPISEQPLDWDQRHTVTVQARVADPSRWGVRLIGRYGSGFPFTPTFRDDRRPDPARTNSRRLPSTSDVTVQGEKRLHLWGHDVDLFVDVRNAMNAKNLASPSFSVYPNPYVGQSGDEYLIYFTETARGGGAYLRDRDGDTVLDWIPLNDPRAFEEGRYVRTGIKIDF